MAAKTCVTRAVDLRTAAGRLGVHYQTAYRWVRDGTLQASKVSGVYDVTEDEVARLADARALPSPPPRRATVRSWDHQVERLFGTLAVGDELAARVVVDRLHEGGIPIAELCDHLVAPALRRIGTAWADGILTVAHEHRSAAICERILARVAEHPRGRPRGVAVAATPPGELHGLPSIMAAMTLRADRWAVHHAGCDVPAEDVLGLAQDVGARLLVLSVTQPTLGPVAEALAARAQELGIPALVGRPGATLRELLDGTRQRRRPLSA